MSVPKHDGPSFFDLTRDGTLVGSRRECVEVPVCPGGPGTRTRPSGVETRNNDNFCNDEGLVTKVVLGIFRPDEFSRRGH